MEICKDSLQWEMNLKSLEEVKGYLLALERPRLWLVHSHPLDN